MENAYKLKYQGQLAGGLVFLLSTVKEPLSSRHIGDQIEDLL